MNKVIIRNGLLSVAAILILFFILKSRSPFGKNNSSFQSEPEKEITKIEFSQGNKKLYLEKDNDNWLINGEIEARKSGIAYIINVLQEIRIKSPVSPELFESEIDSNRIVPVRVKVFEKRKLLKTFLVFKTQANIYGNIMKIKDRSKPFIVYVPGYESDIGSGFTLNELFWQPYAIFNLMPSEISSISFENVLDTASSFSIDINNHNFTFSDLNSDLKGWDSTLVNRYLSYFTRIPFESWALELGDDQKKIIESQQPLYKIAVNTTTKTKIVLTLWERMTDEKGERVKDTDRLFGKTQDRNELFIVRYFDIDPILKKRSYFFNK